MPGKQRFQSPVIMIDNQRDQSFVTWLIMAHDRALCGKRRFSLLRVRPTFELTSTAIRITDGRRLDFSDIEPIWPMGNFDAPAR